MTHLLNRFSLHAANWNSLVVLALIVIWIGVLACVVSSILTQPFDYRQRIFWIVLIIVLTFLGILAYLPFAFRKEDLPHIFLHHKKRPRKSKSHRSGPEP